MVLSDETFHQTFLSSYKAIISFDKYRFTCIMLDSIRKKFIYFFHKENEVPLETKQIEQLINDNYLINSELEKQILIATPYAYSFPTSFNPSAHTEHLSNLFEDKQQPVVITASVSETCFVFSIEKNIYSVFTNLPKTKLYSHIQQHLLQSQYFSKKIKSKQQIHIHFHKKFFEAVCYENTVLQLVNTYPYQNEDDILYFIHLIIQTLNFTKEDCSLVISGFIEKNDNLFNQLKSLKISYQFTNLNNLYIYSYRFNELKAHQFSSMFFLPYENN